MRTLLLLSFVVPCLAQEISPEQLIEAGHWKRARALVERRLREAPDDPNANFLASQIQSAFGDRTSPPALAEKAVRLDGSVARYHRQLAEVQGLIAQHANILQQIPLARRFRKEIDATLERDPQDTQALRDLLEFYLVMPGLMGGDGAKAEAMAEQIGAIDEVEGFLAKARIADFRKDPVQAEKMYRRAAEVRPPSYKAQAAAGKFLALGHRDDAAAEAAARKALSLDPSRVDGYGILAEVYAGRGDWSALGATLASAAQAIPDDGAPYFQAADRLLSEKRDPARAERYLRRYLGQEPEGNQPTVADAHWKLGLSLHLQGKGSEAVREWKLAVQLDPASPAARELKKSGNASAGSLTSRPGGAW